MRRYDNRTIFRNQEKIFEKLFRERGIPLARHYETPRMGYPNASDMMNIETATHIWSQGDRFFKLAHKYYGDAEMWWVIAWFNKTPTEGHLRLGDPIAIPINLENAMIAYSRGA